MARTRHDRINEYRRPRLRPHEDEDKWTEKEYWEDEDKEEDSEDWDIYDGLDDDLDLSKLLR